MENILLRVVHAKNSTIVVMGYPHHIIQRGHNRQVRSLVYDKDTDGLIRINKSVPFTLQRGDGWILRSQRGQIVNVTKMSIQRPENVRIKS